MWENIWPKDNDGSDPENPPNPCVSANGKYAVRMWVVDQWRCVWVDDRMPVDVFGRAAFPGARPIQLWPLLLCKATLKLMKHYGVLPRVGSHRVPMVTWLTGWPKENFGVNNAEGALHDRLLNALTDAVPPVRDKHKAKNALPTVYLRERWLPDHPPPRIIALCGPAGVGKQALVDRLCEEYPERFGYGLATTTRPPHAHEVDGTHFHFVPALGARARWWRISRRAREAGRRCTGKIWRRRLSCWRAASTSRPRSRSCPSPAMRPAGCTDKTPTARTAQR